VTLQIERVVVADPETVAAVRRLLPQLSDTAVAPEAYDLESIVTSPATTMFVARDADRSIVGMLTLALFRLPSGVRAWIEDVVVDEAARGLGAGRALVDAALALAADSGAEKVDLTSRPSREPARRLYESMGFEERTTTVFRRALS
jgi:ribosomal protein S18 acetylase RimI-like enzyme